MTPQEINEAVARKLGWTVDKTSDYLPWYGRPNSSPLSAMVRELPNYSTDISAAWEIIEHLGPQFHALTRDWDDGDYWLKISDGVLSFGKPNILAEAWADTVPMAICLAFLKLDKNG